MVGALLATSSSATEYDYARARSDWREAIILGVSHLAAEAPAVRAAPIQAFLLGAGVQAVAVEVVPSAQRFLAALPQAFPREESRSIRRLVAKSDLDCVKTALEATNWLAPESLSTWQAENAGLAALALESSLGRHPERPSYIGDDLLAVAQARSMGIPVIELERSEDSLRPYAALDDGELISWIGAMCSLQRDPQRFSEYRDGLTRAILSEGSSSSANAKRELLRSIFHRAGFGDTPIRLVAARNAQLASSIRVSMQRAACLAVFIGHAHFATPSSIQGILAGSGISIDTGRSSLSNLRCEEKNKRLKAVEQDKKSSQELPDSKKKTRN